MIKFPDRASKQVDHDLYEGPDTSIYDYEEGNLNFKFDFALARVRLMKNQIDRFEIWKARAIIIYKFNLSTINKNHVQLQTKSSNDIFSSLKKKIFGTKENKI